MLGRVRRAGGLLTAATAALLLAYPAAGTAAGPKLVAHAETPVVSAGQAATVGLTATNRSKSKTAKVKLRLVLSADRRESKDDVAMAGKAKVPALRPGKAKTVSFTAKVPTKVDPGAYNVLLCAAKCRPMKGSARGGAAVQRVDVAPGLDTQSAASGAFGTDGGRVDARLLTGPSTR